MFHHFWHFIYRFERTTLNDIYKQNAKLPNQQFYLRKLQRINCYAVMSLTQCGFGGSHSGCSLFSLHSDLILVYLYWFDISLFAIRYYIQLTNKKVSRFSLGRMLNRHHKGWYMGCCYLIFMQTLGKFFRIKYN